MFDDLNKNEKPQGLNPVVKPAEDIFAATEPVKPAAFQPKANPAGLPPENNPAGLPPEADNKKFMVLGGIVIAVIIIFAIGIYGFSKFTKNSNEPTANNEETQNTQEENVNLNTGEQAVTETGTTTEIVEQTPTEQPIDSDQDGLTDEEEATLGTNPNSIDSDNDGLFDREEIKTFGTDPMNPDTDGDGYKDGEEVTKGYNPKGPGKLYDLAQ